MKKRIFIVDDSPLMRRGYAALIGREPDMTVCGDTGSAQEAMATIPESMPDLLICDISLGGMSGLDLVRHLKCRSAELAVLFISMHDEHAYVGRARAAGANGYMIKSEVAADLVTAIRRVLSGEFWASEQIAPAIVP